MDAQPLAQKQLKHLLLNIEMSWKYEKVEKFKSDEDYYYVDTDNDDGWEGFSALLSFEKAHGLLLHLILWALVRGGGVELS